MGTSRVLCCVVNVYGMQHLSWLSFTLAITLLDHCPPGYLLLKKKKIIVIILKRRQTKNRLRWNNCMIKITLRICQYQTWRLDNAYSNILDLMALIYHALAQALCSCCIIVEIPSSPTLKVQDGIK